MALQIEHRLEIARDWLDEGKPARSLRAIPRRNSVPAVFRPERDFLEAESWRAQGFFIRALRLYHGVLSALNPKMDPALWIEAALAQAACHRSLGRVAEARADLRRAESAAKTFHFSLFQEQIDLERALVDRAEGLYGQSLRKLSVILKRKSVRKAWDEASFVLWAIGGALRFQGHFGASRSAFEKSLVFAIRAKDPAAQAYALFGLGGVTRVMGRLNDSVRYYGAAGRAFRQTDDIFGKAYAHCGLANALRQLGRLAEAESNYLKSHKLYSQLEDEVDLAYVEWGLGKIYLERGGLSKALAYLKKALQLFTRHHETRGQVLSEVALAQALHASGRTEEAERLFAQGLARSRQHRIHAHLEVFT